MDCTFTNDGGVTVKLLPNNPKSKLFRQRDRHEVMFRRIHTYLIQEGLLKDNIIDLGAWIGDNSLPWSLQIGAHRIVYAIDPSPDNIDFIEQTCLLNGIENVKTIQKAIGEKVGVVSTNDNLDHCAFYEGGRGRNKVETTTLDVLHEDGILKDVGCIHLDVEGMEEKVIKGARTLIRTYRPIITFEQHLGSDKYLYLSDHLANVGYNVFLINEILPGCHVDCRNLIAFPESMAGIEDKINQYLRNTLLLLVSRSWVPHDDTVLEKITFSATVYGYFISGREYHNVLSVQIEPGLYVFAVNDNNYTKFIIIDNDGNWIEGRYILGRVDVSSWHNVIDAYRSAQGRISERRHYNVKNLKKL